MKVKFYLRMLLAAIAALFVATACSDSDDEKGPDPGPDVKPLTFKLDVSGIEKDQAKLAVTPSDQTAVYYYNAVKKSIYDALGSDKAFLEDDLAFLQAEAAKQQMTLSAYLQSKTGRGTATYTLTGLEKQTEYYAYVYGIKLDGTVTSELVKSVFTSGEGKDDPGPGPGGDAPKFKEFNLQAGDSNGTDSDTKISITVAATTTITHGKLYLNETSVVEEALGSGFTYESIIAQYGEPLDAEAIGYINEGGLLYTLGGLDPETDYTIICMIGNDDGETVTHGAVSTTAPDAETDGPKLALSIRIGDHDGNNTDTHVVLSITAPGTTSGKYGLFTKASVDAAIAAGNTYEMIIKNEKNGVVMPANYIEAVAGNGMNLALSGLSPGTAYTAIVLVSNAKGDTVKAVSATTTGGSVDPADGPELELTLTAGDNMGLNKDTKVYMGAYAPTAASCKYFTYDTADIEALIEKGATYEDIVEANGKVMTAEWLSYLTEDPGIGVTFSGYSPNTSITAIVKVTDAAGKSTTKTAVTSTEGEVTPTTIELKNLAQGEMDFYGDAYSLPTNDYANWTIYLADGTINLSDLSGTGDILMMELNTAKGVSTEITPGTYNVMADRLAASFVAFTCVPGYTSGTSPYGTWYIKDKKALNKATQGNVVVTKSGDDYTFTFELVDESTATTMKGSYTGPMEYYDFSDPVRAPWKDAANAPRKSVDTRKNVSAASVSAIKSVAVMERISAEAMNTSVEVSDSMFGFTPSVVLKTSYISKVRSVRNN